MTELAHLDSDVALRTPSAPPRRPRRRPGPGPSRDDTTERFRAYRASGDRALRNALVEEHRYLAEIAARRFANRGEPLADLVQVALLGLVKAVERFDPDFGVTFSTFASPTLLGELRRHFRDTTWAVHVTRRAQELHLAQLNALEQLTHQLGRSPTADELAGAMGCTVEDVIHGIEAGNAYRAAPIEARAGDDTEERRFLAVEDEDVPSADARLMLGRALRGLPERERRIVQLRFFEDRTQAEIGAIVGLSQVQVSRVLRASLETLRSGLGEGA